MEIWKTVLSVGLLRVVVSLLWGSPSNPKFQFHQQRYKSSWGSLARVGRVRKIAEIQTFSVFSDMFPKWANEFKVLSNALQDILEALKNTLFAFPMLNASSYSLWLTVCQEYDKHLKFYRSPIRRCYYFSHVTYKRMNPWRGHIICLRQSS